MPKFYLNLGYKLKKKALCYSHLNNTVDILDRNIVMDYFRHENHWQSSQKKKNNNKFNLPKTKKSNNKLYKSANNEFYNNLLSVKNFIIVLASLLIIFLKLQKKLIYIKYVINYMKQKI